MSDADMLQIIRRFWCLDAEMQHTLIETRLFFFALQIASIANSRHFTRGDRRLAAMAGISINSLRQARIRLATDGLLAFEAPPNTGGRGDEITTEYRFCVSVGDTQRDTQRDTPRARVRDSSSLTRKEKNSLTRKEKNSVNARTGGKSDLFAATLGAIHADYPDTDKTFRRSPEVEKSLERLMAGKSSDEQTAILQKVGTGVRRYADYWRKLPLEEKKFHPPKSAADWLDNHGFESGYQGDDPLPPYDDPLEYFLKTNKFD